MARLLREELFLRLPLVLLTKPAVQGNKTYWNPIFFLRFMRDKHIVLIWVCTLWWQYLPRSFHLLNDRTTVRFKVPYRITVYMYTQKLQVIMKQAVINKNNYAILIITLFCYFHPPAPRHLAVTFGTQGLDQSRCLNLKSYS